MEVFSFKFLENNGDTVVLFDSSRDLYVSLNSNACCFGYSKNEISNILIYGKWVSSGGDTDINRMVDSADIFEGILLKIKAFVYFWIYYLTACEKDRIEDVKHFVYNVNERTIDNMTPLIIGKYFLNGLIKF